MKYGIIGVGEATASAIHEALADVCKADKKAHFLIHARRNPQGAVPSVYDFLVDNECKFTVYTKIDDNAPKALVNSAVEAHKTENPISDILQNAEEILLLWDEKDEDASKRLAVMSADEGMAIRDLTMALTPIVVDSDEPKEKVAKEETPVVPFSRDELMNMNIGVLRRQAKSLGLELGRVSKEEIVEAIMFDAVNKDMPIIASDIPSSTPVAPQYGEGSLTWIENGVLCTNKLTATQVAWLIQELKTQPI